jgi:hypothetical protein
MLTDRRFRGLAASIIRAMMTEAVSTSETLVNFYQTTWRNIPEDRHLNFNFGLDWYNSVK